MRSACPSPAPLRPADDRSTIRARVRVANFLPCRLLSVSRHCAFHQNAQWAGYDSHGNEVIVGVGSLLRDIRQGVVFVDDFQLASVARAASFCVTNLGWTLEEVSTADDRHHWAVLRTSTAPDTRPFDYFMDF